MIYMFDTLWIARVVPSRASTAQSLIDTGKPCDATDADFSALHSVGIAFSKDLRLPPPRCGTLDRQRQRGENTR